MWKTQIQFLRREDSLEKGMATQSSILAWRIPWTEEPVGCSLWGRRVGHDWVTNTLVRGTGDTVICIWSGVSGAQSCGTEPLTCGIWCDLQVVSELNCRRLSWCCRTSWCDKPLHTNTSGVRSVLSVLVSVRVQEKHWRSKFFFLRPAEMFSALLLSSCLILGKV